jgi:hypothetical protein
MINIFFILFSIFIIGCANTSTVKVNSIPSKNTSVIKETITKKSSIDNKEVHYRNRYGDDFGYFDRDGYYCNNIYYPYDDRYRYEDRLYRRGYFSTNVKHIQVYEDDDRGDGYYYPVSSTHPRKRVMHPEHLEERNIGSGGYYNLKY